MNQPNTGSGFKLRETLDIDEVNQGAEVLRPVRNHPWSKALDLAFSAGVVFLNPVTSHERIAGQTGKYPQQFFTVTFLRQ